MQFEKSKYFDSQGLIICTAYHALFTSTLGLFKENLPWLMCTEQNKKRQITRKFWYVHMVKYLWATKCGCWNNWATKETQHRRGSMAFTQIKRQIKQRKRKIVLRGRNRKTNKHTRVAACEKQKQKTTPDIEKAAVFIRMVDFLLAGQTWTVNTRDAVHWYWDDPLKMIMGPDKDRTKWRISTISTLRWRNECWVGFEG